MNFDTGGPHQHTNEVDARRPRLTSKLVHLISLGVINGVDRIILMAHGSHLDRDPLETVDRQKVNFAFSDRDIGRDHIETVTGKKIRGKLLSKPAEAPP